jgi:hypothetical protein
MGEKFMKKILVLCLTISLFFVFSVEAQKKKAAPKPFPTSGEFHNITVGKESGDLGGTSIYLTQSDTQTYAVVRTAAGDLSNPVLVPAKISGKNMRTVEFSVLSESGSERKYKGTVSAAALMLDELGSLKRTCGAGGSKTYGNIIAGKESGDYGGIEVYLINNIGQWFAIVTIAEGVILPPQLVEAKVTGKNENHLEFTIPSDNGGRKFTGTISSKGGGSLTLSEQGSRSVLKTKCYK